MQEPLQSLDIANYGNRINRIFKILRNCHHRKSSLIFINTSNTICNFTRSRWSDRTAFQLVFAFESFQSRTLWTLAFDSSISQDAHCKMHSDEMLQPWASASFPLQNFGDSVVGVWRVRGETPKWDSGEKVPNSHKTPSSDAHSTQRHNSKLFVGFDPKFATPLIAHNNTINRIDYWAAGRRSIDCSNQITIVLTHTALMIQLDMKVDAESSRTRSYVTPSNVTTRSNVTTLFRLLPLVQTLLPIRTLLIRTLQPARTNSIEQTAWFAIWKLIFVCIDSIAHSNSGSSPQPLRVCFWVQNGSLINRCVSHSGDDLHTRIYTEFSKQQKWK